MKVAVYAIMGVLTLAVAVAIWISVLNTAGTANVLSSGSPLQLSSAYTTIDLDASNQTISGNISFEVDNINNVISADIVTNVSYVDVVDGCDQYEGDASVEMFFNGEPISFDENKNFSSGINTITGTITTLQHSCPQAVVLNTTVTSTA